METTNANTPAQAPSATRHAHTPPLTVTLLGTGTSTGVPVIGCDCEVCTSDDPRDARTRCACYIEVGDMGMGLLIDTGPDFREQALREGLDRIDAVCYTHHHFDHVVGIDDLRPFFRDNRRVMPCYAHADTAAVLRNNYDYIFGADPYPGAANVELRVVDRPFRVPSRTGEEASVPVDPVLLRHGDLPVYGYRIGRFAYLTDASSIPEASYEQLQGIDTLVLDALRARPHPTHFSFEEAVAAARRIGAQETYFVHMTHNARHTEADARLPDDIHLAYDGLTVDVPAYDAAV